MKNNIQQMLYELRLSTLRKNLDIRLQEARGNNLDHDEFLELILQDEIDGRTQRRIERLTKLAGFRDQKTLEDFEFSFNTSVKAKQCYELATGKFIDNTQDVLLIGPPGVGKSHLAQAIGSQLIRSNYKVLYRSIFDVVRDLAEDDLRHQRIMNRYLKVDLLIIDDMGIKQLPPKSGEYLFEIIMRRYEVKSTMMTSNRPIEEWGKLIGDVPAATAILDRFLHHAHILEIKGKSYRLKNKASQTNK